jgi:hypothetical protein
MGVTSASNSNNPTFKEMKIEKSTSRGLTNSAPEKCQIDALSNRRLNRKRFLLAALLMGASLTVFLWGAGGISYGDSARPAPFKVTATARFYPTIGTPNDALVTDDNAYVLVSVTRETTPCPTMSPCPSNSPCESPTPTPTASPTATSTPRGTPAGVQVFSTSDFTNNPCGGQEIINFPSSNFPPSHRLEAAQHVDGMQFFPGSPQVSVGAAVERQGAEFFRLVSLTEPCGMDGVIQVPQYPVINNCNCPNSPPGTFDVAVTPDGHYAFVANEYGQLPSPTPTTETGGGTVGVIRVARDAAGRFRPGTRSIQHNNTIYIPGGNTIPGITMSHDGRYLYVACEGSGRGINPNTGQKYSDPTNVEQTQNGNILCPGCIENPQGDMGSCDNMAEGGGQLNGLLAVIDVDMAIRGMGQASIIRIISGGCAPVRAVESADGQHLFVAARGRNEKFPIEDGYQILVFDVPTLVSQSPNNAFLGYGSSGGTAPVGMALFNNETLLAVANSNRFHANCECREHPEQCTANVAILDVTNPGSPTIQQIISNPNNPNSPDFPRNITVGPDDSTLYVPNAGSMMLEVITTSVH